MSSFHTADGTVITLARFNGSVTHRLHSGSEDPGAAAGVVQAGPSVSGSERQLLLGACNSGFKLSTGTGGYEQEGHMSVPLQADRRYPGRTGQPISS